MLSRLVNLGKVCGSDNDMKVLDLLDKKGRMCVGDMEIRLGMAQTSVSKSLKRLRDAGVVECEVDGSFRHYSVTGFWKGIKKLK